MKIGVIGTGSVGSALGTAWSKHGHEVFYGMRDPKKAAPAGGTNVKHGSVAQAARFADVVVLATPWTATEAAVKACGDLSGKVVIDCTNPLAADLSSLVIGTHDSAGESVGRWAVDARVVKCFNTLGAQNFATPFFRDQIASMFLCGNDADAKETVEKLGEDLGFEMIDIGPLTQSRLLEPLALLWISMAYKSDFGPNIAFKLLRR
jgi:8-hydroxy-5-deazaflavin:NADPH oxidoreductase